MHIASLIGVTGALLLIALATGGKFLQFVDWPAMAIVIGGTGFCVMAKSTLAEFREAIGVAKAVLTVSPQTPDEVIDALTEVGTIVRYDDRWMIVLEEREFSHAFLAKGVRMWVDGVDHAVMRDAMLREVAQEKSRFDRGRDFFSFAQEIAPGMGMIGTLVGLVLMMGNMTDPRTIGPGMAVALLTTLYGAILANVILSPLVQKIVAHGKKVRRNNELVVSGILFLRRGGDARLLADLLLGNASPQEIMAAPKADTTPPVPV